MELRDSRRVRVPLLGTSSATEGPKLPYGTACSKQWHTDLFSLLEFRTSIYIGERVPLLPLFHCVFAPPRLCVRYSPAKTRNSRIGALRRFPSNAEPRPPRDGSACTRPLTGCKSPERTSKFASGSDDNKLNYPLGAENATMPRKPLPTVQRHCFFLPCRLLGNGTSMITSAPVLSRRKGFATLESSLTVLLPVQDAQATLAETVEEGPRGGRGLDGPLRVADHRRRLGRRHRRDCPRTDPPLPPNPDDSA